MKPIAPIANNPMTNPVGPVHALGNYLLQCSRRDGRRDTDISDAFLFEDARGQPDLARARHFAETLRAQLRDQAHAHRIGITQVNHLVRVRVIPRSTPGEDWPVDAICRPPVRLAACQPK